MEQDRLYRMGEIEEWFHQDRKTIIKRLELYEPFFTAFTKQERKGSQRSFTERDARVYATIHHLELAGRSPEDITYELNRRGDDLQPLPAGAAEVDDVTTALVFRQQALSATAQRDAALAQVEQKEQELVNLREQMRQTTLDMAKIMAQREGELQREIGRLQYELELERKKP